MLAADRVKATSSPHVCSSATNSTPDLFQLAWLRAHHHVPFSRLEGPWELSLGSSARPRGTASSGFIGPSPWGDLRTAQHVGRRQGPPGAPRRLMPTDSGRSTEGAMGLTQPSIPRGIGDVFSRPSRWSRCRGPDCSITQFPSHRRSCGQMRATDPRGEGVGRLAHLVGFLQPPLGGQLQPVGNVVCGAGQCDWQYGTPHWLQRPGSARRPCRARIHRRSRRNPRAGECSGGRFSGISRSTGDGISTWVLLGHETSPILHPPPLYRPRAPDKKDNKADLFAVFSNTPELRRTGQPCVENSNQTFTYLS